MHEGKLFLILGGVNAVLVVVLGAFGAHGLKERLASDALAIYETAVQYHFYHALGLLVVGLVGWHLTGSGLLKWSGWLMLGGIVLFSGSLYAVSLSGQRWLGAVTPFGGVAFIAAWLAFAAALWRT
ncbi:MAG: DUF423 domain-containing protein [Gammaproteobacteria bacterium]|nr:DUF423 domain-containing protein [Gammaproteobacteria bacterium]NIR83567.1 DUF423 domain-containing protein [Gammaproteobacteria bacterium]NIR91489.1 DUF423 domain-containing protein [Gammaproteobacteria bacterium]NIU04729.1 DUF423 domain-containing protein [Gammaproteobacteria bacterium]NIV51771.1 DUF423 domain-containing protein [Gammaproteobacteria bacterium]